MLSINPVGSSPEQVQYYVTLGRDAHDYYSEGNRPGRWWGEGATRLGLVGDVKEEEFRNILLGRSPDGRETWGHPPKNGKRERRVAIDTTYSLVKSVPVAWLSWFSVKWKSRVAELYTG